jgi:D-amino-acid dehydrogenase
MKPSSALIIGGGAIGLFTAYFLSKKGIETTVVDENSIPGGETCSAGNAGMLVPSHFIRLANRQTLKEGMHNMFKPSSALGIKWSVKPEFFNWLWNFYRQSVRPTETSGMQYLASMHLDSRDLYRLIQDTDIAGLTMEMSGLVMASVSESIFESDIKTARLAGDIGMPVEIWSKGEFEARNASLAPEISGAVFYPLDGKVNPFPMMNELRKYLQAKGVRFIEETKVTGWKKVHRKIYGVISTAGELNADKYVICGGALSNRILPELGLSIPLQPAKGVSYHFANPGNTISHPTLLQDHHIAITPYETTTRIAGNFILGDGTPDISGDRLQNIYKNVRSVFPTWNIPQPEVADAWTGARPVTPDGMPVIGFSSHYPNLSINTGHAMMGISLAPVSGRIAADLIAGEPADPRTTSFLNPGRFGNRF